MVIFVYKIKKQEKWVCCLNTLTSVSYLGSVLEDQGKYEEAEAMY
jgi:hypothetical protein